MAVESAQNGGFPEPVAGEPVRLVSCTHEACGASTRLRLPQALPARAVRRVVCDGCRRPYACAAADDGVVPAPGPGRAGTAGQGRVWKYASLPLAAAIVIAVLVLVQGGGGGGGEPGAQATAPAAPAAPAGERQAPAASASGGAELVKGSSYTLALPDGWERTEPPSGATFAAAARDGGAEATLWVHRDPSLSLPEFESQSLENLRQVAGSAEVTDRTAAPTAAGTIVTLAAKSPPGAPEYEVTLRVGGPYRYYLATTVEPDASQKAAEGAELIRSSFVPVAAGKSG